MTSYSRRDLLARSAGVAGLLASAASPDAARAQDSSVATGRLAVKASHHDMQALPFNPAKLTSLSERLIQSHWENNYGGSVKAFNAAHAKLAELSANADTPPYLIGALKRECLMRSNSVVLHELYFGNLGGSGSADSATRTTLSRHFGDFDTWETDFRRTGAALAGGSGWVVLGWNIHLQVLENYWLWDHLHSPAASVPLLVMDMYEHSYALDFGAAAAKYIDAFFANVNWEKVAQRLTPLAQA